jgi:glyoxylate reductase
MIVVAVDLFDAGRARLAGLAVRDVAGGDGAPGAGGAAAAALAARVRAELGAATALICTTNLAVDADLLACGPHLRVVSTSSVGYEHIDLAACAARGIAVGNTPGVVVEATADIGYALIVLALRALPAALAWARDGSWAARGPVPLAEDLAGKVLGIFGLGAVGLALARRAQASGMRTIYHNRAPRADEAAHAVRYVAFDELLREADVLAIAAPQTPQTLGLFGAETFARMKRSAVLVNVARGPIVDSAALARALREGTIAGAALDVTDPEPLPPGHELFAAPNLIVLPHVGTATRQTRERMALLAIENALAGIEGRPLPAPVNPAASSPGPRGARAARARD